MNAKNKRLAAIVLAAALLWLVPFMSKQLTGAPNWSRFDFVIVGVLLIGAGLLFELVLRAVTKTEYRIALFLAILAALFLIWVELAVGLFGTPFAGS